MIDLHTHSLFSDGELLPSELIQRAENIGYTHLAITDHGDISNLEWIVPRIVEVCQYCNRFKKIIAIPGIELTHLPPKAIPEMASRARKLGAAIIVVHGETISEPVAPGTNLAALKSDIDILAHPGLLSEEEAELATKQDIFLEISCRNGHSLTNGHVAKMAKKFGAKLIINTDAHSPDNLVSTEKAVKIARGAGLDKEEVNRAFQNSISMVKRAQ